MKYVAYYRVSSQKQGKSGLGLEAQRQAAKDFAGDDVVKEFIEVESGKHNDRPQLRKAIAYAKLTRSTLLIAKLDRLSRNLHFISTLMETKVNFVCCDMPTANRLTIHILAAVAEAEAKAISDRTKGALAAAKTRGTRLGAQIPAVRRALEQSRSQDKAAKAAARAHRAKDLEAYTEIMPEVWELREAGLSYQSIADHFNERRIPNKDGRPWNRQLVYALLKRYPSKRFLVQIM